MYGFVVIQKKIARLIKWLGNRLENTKSLVQSLGLPEFFTKLLYFPLARVVVFFMVHGKKLPTFSSAFGGAGNLANISGFFTDITETRNLIGRTSWWVSGSPPRGGLRVNCRYSREHAFVIPFS